MKEWRKKTGISFWNTKETTDQKQRKDKFIQETSEL